MIEFVVINPSEYRLNDFDQTHIKTINQRWQIDKYIINPDYEDGEPDDYKYIVSTSHFTSYSHLKYRICESLLDNSKLTPNEAYRFYIMALKDLKSFYCMEHTSNYINDFSTDDYSVCGLDNEGFPNFIDKYFPISLNGQSKKELFGLISKAQYLYYSSLKLISYPFCGGGVCNGEIAWNTVEEFDNFTEDPPPIKNKLPHSHY